MRYAVYPNRDKMGEEKQQSIPALPWMRDPVDVTLTQQLPPHSVPSLHPKYCTITLLHCYFCLVYVFIYFQSQFFIRLKSALEDMGISNLFPVQVAVWHETVGPGNFERDICVNSPTGSGKTLAYALPLVQMLSGRVTKCLHALVVVPTRDLALQVKQVFDAVASPLGLRVGLAVGQSSLADEISELVEMPARDIGTCYDPHCISLPRFQSKVDILVATPGRLMDHINTTIGFTLEHLYYLVSLNSHYFCFYFNCTINFESI